MNKVSAKSEGGFYMEGLFIFARLLHIVGGFLALFVFWLPIITRKGGKLHTQIGWIYVFAMASVSITALYMGVYRLTWEPGHDPDTTAFSWFLLFIAILSGATAWYGLRVLRYKKRKRSHRQAIDYIFPILLLTSGIAISIYGWIIHFPLLQYFPVVGIFLGATQLQYWLTSPKRKSHWIVEHIVGMLSCCIATITAFVVFGAPRLLGVDSVSLFIWFIPTIMIVPLIIGFTTYYAKKLNGKPAEGN
ncbi:MAG TPA: DUF2306 domain-containing protein [Virgibacillus sp.]|nr:DUF2306 domain-containing protein [Virgibacillus sp.]HLR67612.1 DUF2306 domain-containing protein [Virgibacillus sp.]